MKVLWLCNMVLPDFSQEFKIKKSNAGGWMTGMLHELEKIEGIDISLIFPIYDKGRLHDGNCNGHDYYTFLSDADDEIYYKECVKIFERIIDKVLPDVVHIWGTEYPHTAAMLVACRNGRILSRVVIHIQGLVSIISKHYLAGIPEKYKKLKTENSISMEEERALYENRGGYEKESIETACHVIGRTDWDKACVESINPLVRYHYCNEILRDIFWQFKGKWEYSKCRKYSIFISQASYPIKGLHYFLQALPYVIKKYPDTHVYVAGKNIMIGEQKCPYAVYLESIMDQFELREYVSFLGSLDEEQMIQQYLKANVYVLASTIENSSNSLNEAMLLGVPCVASYVGGICNFIDLGRNGFLYSYDEPTLLAYYICKVFENNDGLCEKISNNSVDKMSKIANPESIVVRNLNIYREILKHNRCYR